MNETFKEKFPHIKLTLSKIRRYIFRLIPLWLFSFVGLIFSCLLVFPGVFNVCVVQRSHTVHSVTVSRLVNVSSPLLHTSLKREMRAMSEECGLQPVTISMAFVYFEKLVLQGRLNKQNRKLVAAACVLLAAKISSDLRKPEVKQLIDVSEFSTHTQVSLLKRVEP